LICAVALTGVIIFQAAKYWADGEDDDGSLETRVDSSQGNWKRAPRPTIEEEEKEKPRRGSVGSAVERNTRRTSQSPSARRRSPVKRKTAATALGLGSGSPSSSISASATRWYGFNIHVSSSSNYCQRNILPDEEASSDPGHNRTYS